MKFLGLKNLNPEQKSAAQAIMIQSQMAENQQIAEKRKAETEKQKVRDAELDEIVAKQRLEREKQLRLEERQRREDSAKNLEINLKREFFERNPEALQSDFDQLLPELKKQKFLERMKHQRDSETLIRSGMRRM